LSRANRIGVVTVTYNASYVIDGFMNSLLQQAYSDFVLYLTDNSSSDQTPERIAQFQDSRIRLFQNQENVGWAEGVNRGVREALIDGCSFILLMNNDIEFEPSLLEELITGLKRYSCDMIVPKILFFDDREMIWSAGGTFRPWRGYAPAHYGVFEIDRGQFDVPRRVEHGPACCLLIRREVFERIGLLDGRFFLGMDDADFCFRAMRAGLVLFYLPSAKLFHKASSSTGGIGSDVSARYNTRGHIIYMLKHLGVWRCLFFLPAYQIYLALNLITRKINFSRFLLHEHAFFEGVRIWRSSAVGESTSRFCPTN